MTLPVDNNPFLILRPTKISENVRHHLTKRPSTANRKGFFLELPADGRTGLAYTRCQSYQRPKFICAKPECRRSVKTHYDPDQFEYDIDATQSWKIRPLRERDVVYDKAWRNFGLPPFRMDQKEREVLLMKHLSHPEDVTADELEKLERTWPTEWWVEVSGYQLREGKLIYEHHTRCPSCGETPTKVGSTFRIPPKKDNRAWKEIQDIIASGADMVAKFEFCPTEEDFQEMLKDAERVKNMEKHAGEWKEEKQRRLQALGLLSPTTLEDGSRRT